MPLKNCVNGLLLRLISLFINWDMPFDHLDLFVGVRSFRLPGGENSGMVEARSDMLVVRMQLIKEDSVADLRNK